MSLEKNTCFRPCSLPLSHMTEISLQTAIWTLISIKHVCFFSPGFLSKSKFFGMRIATNPYNLVSLNRCVLGYWMLGEGFLTSIEFLLPQ